MNPGKMLAVRRDEPRENWTTSVVLFRYFRVEGRPVGRMQKTHDGWLAELVGPPGGPTATMSLGEVPLSEAQAEVEKALFQMGWQL